MFSSFVQRLRCVGISLGVVSGVAGLSAKPIILVGVTPAPVSSSAPRVTDASGNVSIDDPQFQSAPAPLPAQHLGDHAVVRGLPEYPVIWKRVENDELICSANGHAFSLTASPRNLALLERLNRGGSHPVDGLIADHSGSSEAHGVEFETTAADVRALLEKLVRLRAIVVDV